MLTVLTWPSKETSPCLLPQEVDALFNFCYQAAEYGALNDGKYKGVSRVLYWERMKGNN